MRIKLGSLATAQDYYYTPNVSRSTIPGIAAYRSALTLDWLAAEDSRQREMVAAFETEQAPPMRMILTDCMGYATPPSEKIARLLLELLKNLEGDEGPIILDLTQALIRAKLLIETSTLESEPDLESLVKTPNVMMGEPHKTFPRILAAVWLTLTDASTTTKYGWCPINKVTKYLTTNKPVNIAEHMRSLDPVLARARFVMEEFVQHVTPLNMYQKLIGRRKEVSFGQKQQKHGPKENPKICPSACADDVFETEFPEDRWVFRNAKQQDLLSAACSNVHPSSKDFVKRFYAILPYFDKDHSNIEFLHKLRGTIYAMAEGDDKLDREAAIYATVLIPIVFLHRYRDTWCLLERFHRGLRIYQISHPTEKRTALKLLQNLKPVEHKIRSFISDLPGSPAVTRTSHPRLETDDEELYDRKDVKYLKELIKNLG
ncbi:uncharacterized protein LOC114242719 [Bombyx mandarina]|uniref:Uncharacterized protein LOC114242719 n=1 Tax=Bombyx mandarina TaxID=7092 RepID=A0A6J2JJN3_BOMMA|nr:uncharacterized protein LOC114242719 [Bombyx mandarina]